MRGWTVRCRRAGEPEPVWVLHDPDDFGDGEHAEADVVDVDGRAVGAGKGLTFDAGDRSGGLVDGVGAGAVVVDPGDERGRVGGGDGAERVVGGVADGVGAVAVVLGEHGAELGPDGQAGDLSGGLGGAGWARSVG